jgi:hypothetical protein
MRGGRDSSGSEKKALAFTRAKRRMDERLVFAVSKGLDGRPREKV